MNTKLLSAFAAFCLFLLSESVAQPPAKYKKIEKYIRQATSRHLAGVVIYIHQPRYGEWTAAAGLANIAEKVPIEPSNIFSLASIGKMYTAVASMKLYESGRLDLNSNIGLYLPKEVTDHLPNSDHITIRHLLSHQSGLTSYENDPELVSLYTQGKLKLDTLSHLVALRRYVFDKPANFAPGTKFDYSSTNYLLLALAMDQVLPEGHTAYIRNMLREFNYSSSWYRESPNEGTLHYYGDLDQNAKLEDLTAQTIETTNWFKGDDGVYATVTDAAHFLQDLMNEKLVHASTLKLMQSWNQEKKPDYGLGLMADKSFPYGFLLGHSGRGIGVTTDLYYFPKQDMTVAIFCNTGLRGSSPVVKKAYYKMRARIIKKLFLF